LKIGSYITQGAVASTMGRIFTAGDSLKTVDEFVTNWPNKSMVIWGFLLLIDFIDINIYIDYSNEAVPGQILTAQVLAVAVFNSLTYS